ncbi:MAG TPA: OmpA family protein [Polyangiaceae bacterium]|nr:OmpA family protein [Polyangiaceae bacterium]
MTKTIPLAFALSSLLAAGAALGCGGAKPQPVGPDTVATAAPGTTTSRLPTQAPDSPTASAVRISDEIVRACGISAPNAYFAFDSDHVRDDDAHVLQQVATCFSTGPLKGRTLKLVGHADPRGGSEYNDTLGQKRADSVKDYIVGKGMDKAKAESSSRGAMDATGTDDPSWARDRRVDVMLGQ